MNNHKTFVATIKDEPEDEAARSVYADWLEELGDARADYLRLERQLTSMTPNNTEFKKTKRKLRSLQKEIDKDWIVELSRSRIENCEAANEQLRDSAGDNSDIEPEFDFQCPLQWEQLASTDDPTIRSCDQCKRPVFYCDTVKEAQDFARLDQCVAINITANRKANDIPNGLLRDRPVMMGRMTLPKIPNRLKEYVEKVRTARDE